MTHEPHLTTATYPAAVREALLEVGPRVARAAGLPDSWCLAAAGMTREVYAGLGFEGVRVLGVRATVFNDAGWDHWLKKTPLSDWPDEAWSAGTRGTGRISEHSWDGHAVAYVPAKSGGGQAWLIDLSAPQMSRPEHGIHVPPLTLDVDGSFFAGDTWSWKLPGAMLTMEAIPALTKTANEQVTAMAPVIASLARLFETVVEVDFHLARIV